MDKRIGLIVGLTALFAMGSAGAQTPCPTTAVASGINPETGHYFEIYQAPGIYWADAKACAGIKDYPAGSGDYGHLATLTSDSEDLWVSQLRISSGLGEVWVGGSQPSPSPSDPPGIGWRWENSEGAIATPDAPSPSYSNWLPGEPNDYYGPASENYLAIGLGSPPRGWNDESNLGNIQGYIVEYETPRTASECIVSPTSTTACTTIDGQTLTFPPGTFVPGETFSFTAYEFNDPRVVNGKCRNNPGPLTLFTMSDGFPSGVELKIPAYLCGSPRFVVVKLNSDDITILKGTVFVKHETTEKVLLDNLYKCSDPILNNPNANPDPQFQDVVVWQTTNPANMTLESNYSGDFRYVGAATEATNGCGSTTAKVRGASYFVVGMHIDFGNDAYDYPLNPGPNYQQFRALTQYKLSLLKQSVANARAAGTVTNPDGQAMASQVQNAINSLTADDPASALKSMQQFVKKVNTSTYLFPPTVTFNYNGDHLMRGENIVFTLRVKVVPYKLP